MLTSENIQESLRIVTGKEAVNANRRGKFGTACESAEHRV